MVRRPPRSTHCISSAASDVYKRQQRRSARVFRARCTETVFRPTLACSHLLGQEKISPPRKKKCDSPALIENNANRRRPGKMTDRGLEKKPHRMAPIAHFLMDIIQILLRDWIENTMADIGRCKAATDIFQPTLRNFFYKRWPIIFL